MKEYEGMNPDYHYINFYNFFMGCRVTQNRADVKTNTDKTTIDAIGHLRKRNYSGKTSQTFKDVLTSDFGSVPTPYSEDGGYRHKGGYVHYFASNLTFKEAMNKFRTMNDDSVFDPNLISFTIELMFYNQNYQTGITIVYEFLINNAGDVEKYADINAFYLSRYDEHYHQMDESTVGFMYF